MSANEELHEQMHGARDPFERTVAASMAIIAALLAIVSVLGQHFNTEELLRTGKCRPMGLFASERHPTLLGPSRAGHAHRFESGLEPRSTLRKGGRAV